jgi:hypothetical protein
MDILNEKMKFMKQIFPIDSNASNSWLKSESRNSCGPTTLWSSKETHTTPVTTRYAIPVINRYAVLSNHHEQQESNDSISSSKTEPPPRFQTTNNYRNVKEL